MNYKEIFEQRGELYNQAHQLVPSAREMELEAMLRWLVPQAGERILVVAAGGGFDAVGIENHLYPGSADILCLEPSTIFSDLIPSHFEVLHAPLHQIQIGDESVDVVLNLAALHHIELRDEAFDEWVRVLKPGGRIVVGDVPQGSRTGDFLNDVVHRLTPGGHEGVFLEEGYLTNAFTNRGLTGCVEGTESYTWNFKDEAEMIAFSAKIFGMINGSYGDIKAGIEKYLQPEYSIEESRACYEWSLRFFKGTKPA